MERAKRDGSVEPHDHTFSHGEGRCHALRLTVQTSFAEEIASSEQGDHGFFPLLGNDGYFDLPRSTGDAYWQ